MQKDSAIRGDKKILVYQQFGHGNLAQVLLCEICDFFHPVELYQKREPGTEKFSLQLYYKRDSSTGVFLSIWIKFSTKTFIKNTTVAQVVFCKFNKIFKKNYSAEQLLRATSNDLIVARFFCHIYCSLNWKLNGYQR